MAGTEIYTWHGINAVSLLARAARDGIQLPSGSPKAAALADDILRTVDSAPVRNTWAESTACEAAIALGGCGGGKGFANHPRPPVPLQLTGVITNAKVTISPNKVGAGPVVITVSNQTSQSRTLRGLPRQRSSMPRLTSSFLSEKCCSRRHLCDKNGKNGSSTEGKSDDTNEGASGSHKPSTEGGSDDTHGSNGHGQSGSHGKH